MNYPEYDSIRAAVEYHRPEQFAGASVAARESAAEYHTHCFLRTNQEGFGGWFPTPEQLETWVAIFAREFRRAIGLPSGGDPWEDADSPHRV